MPTQLQATIIPTFLWRLPTARRAFSLANSAHADDRRVSDAAPFIVHPLEVASLLHNTGHGDELIAVAILHDTVERSHVEVEDIADQFGSRVADLVAALSEDPGIEDERERKAELRRRIAGFGSDAAAVYAADKVAKVRELRSRATRGEEVLAPDHSDGQTKLEHYVASLTMLEQTVPEHAMVRQLRFELEILRALPPRPDLLDG